MNWNRAFTIQSFAQYFCTITVALLFGFSNPAEARTMTKELCDKATSSQINSEKRECDKIYAEADSSSSANVSTRGSACENAKANAASAYRDLTKACGDSGAGRNCMSQVKKCADIGGSDEFSDDDDVLKAFSSALGVPQNQVSSKCPKYSGQGFFERKDKYTSDLKTVNDDLKDAADDLADLKKDFAKDIKEIQENIADAQKDLKQKQLDIKKDQRERATEQAKTASDLAKNIRTTTSEKLTKQQDISNILRSKNSSLIAMSDAATKRACMKKVKDMKKDYESVNGGSAGSFFTRSSQKKQALQDEYDNCMSQFDQQRMALIEQTDQKIEKTESDINNAQSDIDNMNQQLSSLATTEAAAAKDEAQSVSDATQALTDKITRATTEMKSLQTTAEEKSAAIKKKQAALEARSKEISNSIASLGATPADETSTTKLSQVEGAYDDYRQAVAQIRQAGGTGTEVCSYDDPLDTTAKSTSKSSSKTPTRKAGEQ